MNMQPAAYNFNNMLHTEALQKKYGKIHVQILSDDDTMREVLLLDKDFTARTYALTTKNNEWKQSPEISAVNEAIKYGEPIGEAFKKRGFAIQKNILDVCEINIPYWLQAAFCNKSKTAKMRMMEFVVKKGRDIYNYGIVTEVYSPHFKKPQVNAADEMQVNIPFTILQNFGFTKEDLWRSLEKKATAPHLAKLYASAVLGIKEKVLNIIHEDLPLSMVC